MGTISNREMWEQRHSDPNSGTAEPSLLEFLPLFPAGRALDVAAGTGRNSIQLARRGIEVVAVDWSINGLNAIAAVARQDRLEIQPVIVNLEQSWPFRPESFETVLNISFLERALFPRLKMVLRIGGMLLFDTFLIDQAATGHPRNPRYLLGHYELRDLLSDMELIRYREGIVDYGGGKRAWRATALARRSG
ncbi:MAG TPA: class I SAM-dependent methyltransferase [Candidatus Binataceae bacterium]|nr:class I SAM-dependent methyltransferase [Candidatus Binataceae bacterium]